MVATDNTIRRRRSRTLDHGRILAQASAYLLRAMIAGLRAKLFLQIYMGVVSCRHSILSESKLASTMLLLEHSIVLGPSARLWRAWYHHADVIRR